MYLMISQQLHNNRETFCIARLAFYVKDLDAEFIGSLSVCPDANGDFSSYTNSIHLWINFLLLINSNIISAGEECFDRVLR